MVKKTVLAIPPKSVSCPFCKARQDKPCKTSGGRNLRNALGFRIALLHVARIEKALKLDSLVEVT